MHFSELVSNCHFHQVTKSEVMYPTQGGSAKLTTVFEFVFIITALVFIYCVSTFLGFLDPPSPLPYVSTFLIKFRFSKKATKFKTISHMI